MVSKPLRPLKAIEGSFFTDEGLGSNERMSRYDDAFSARTDIGQAKDEAEDPRRGIRGYPKNLIEEQVEHIIDMEPLQEDSLITPRKNQFK